jgi:hypothetical protein
MVPIGGLIYLIVFISLYGFSITQSLFLFFLFSCICFCALAVQYFYIGSLVDIYGRDSIVFARTTLLAGLSWMLAGAAVSLGSWRQSNIRSLIILAVPLTLISGNLHGDMVLSYGDLSMESGFENLNHTYVAGSFLFFVFLSYSSASTTFIRAIIFPVSAFILFTVGSRSVLLGGLATLVVFEYFWGSRKLLFVYLIIAIFSLYLLLPHLNRVFYGSDLLLRMLITDGLYDSSLIARIEIFRESLAELPSQAFFGDVGFLVRQFGSLGSYMHSVVSAWQFYGVIPFSFFLYFYFKSIKTVTTIPRESLDVITSFGILNIMYAILMLASYSVLSYYLWFGIGFWYLHMASFNDTKTNSHKAS